MRVLQFGSRGRALRGERLLGFCLFAAFAMNAMGPASASATSPYGVAAWGGNIWGQLGDGTFGENTSKNVPVAVVGLSGTKAVAAGGGHSLALLSDGTVVAWGNNEHGQLGNGTTTNSDVPVAVSGLTSVTAISAGERHSLALLSDGTVLAWGENASGQLGNGNTTDSDVPVAVSGLSSVTAISAGGLHSLALLSNGTVMAWGNNEVGQLGNGSGGGGSSSDLPVKVSGLSSVAAISGGDFRSLALLSSGKVMDWGYNSFGGLGDGISTGPDSCDFGSFPEPCSTTPVEVSGLTGVTAIADGMALLGNGTVKDWGENGFGQLGDATHSGPEFCLQPSGLRELPCSTTPVEVHGLSGVTAISAGFLHRLALLGNGTVKAWGENNDEELGYTFALGPETCEEKRYCSATPVEVTELHGTTTIATGPASVQNLAYGPEFPVGESPPEPQLEELYGEENPGEPNQKRACAGDPVSCAIGNLTELQTDLSLSGRGVPLTLTRTYNARSAATQSSPGLFGYGWSSSFSDHLKIDSEAGTVTVVQANSSTVIFKDVGGLGELTAPKWAQAKLVLNSDGTYLYVLPNQETFHFDATGRLLSEADRSGNTTTMNRNAEGRLESITDAAGRKLTLSYNSEGQVESVTDPMGHTAKYGYEAGNLASVTEPGESTPRWQFKYDSSHRLTATTDGRGGITTNEYDSTNRVVSQKDPAGRTTSFEYAELETRITNKATGSVTKEVFTPGYEPESITHGYGTSSASTENFTYDEAGDLTSIIDGNGHSTKYGYDSEGNRTKVIDSDKHETKWTYNGTHDVLTMTTPDVETTTYVRNSAGEPESISRPTPGGTQTTKYTYDSHGNVENITDPLGHIWEYKYDNQGDRTSETDPEGDKRTWEYNEDSQEAATVSPRLKTTKIERDAQGRPLMVTDPLGHKTTYTYDGNGNLETQTDPNGNKTKYTYDADNEPIKIEAPNGTITETGYDGAGQVTSQTDGNKRTTKYVRNVLEQVIEIIDPRERKTTKEYDKAGNPTKLTDPTKRITTNTYDPANQLTEISYSDTKTHAVKYEYNGDGVRMHMTDGSGETSYTYDQLDRLTESKDGHGNKASYEYDLANELTKITYPNGKAVTRAYDKDGRLQKVTDWLEHATQFSYDPDSNLVTTTFPAGTSNVDKYAYNEADQMSEIKMTKGTETLASLLYTRDNAGQVKGVTSKGLPGEEKPGYEYDPNSRLTKGGTTGYEYDAANNPTKLGSSVYTYDKANELETGPSVKYTYDEVGERTKTTPTSGAATTDGYNQAGNLISIERPKEGKTAGMTDTYTYDGNGLRVSQTISGTTSYLAWEMTESLPVILNDGTNSYIYGPSGLLAEQISSAGTVSYLHHDQQGSTRLLTGSTGTVTGSTTFDAYGNKAGSTGTSTTPLGYDGQYTNSDTGLLYMRARVYDPTTAQFLTVDPAVSITRAPYNYAGDNPETYADPSGLWFGVDDLVASGVGFVVGGTVSTVEQVVSGNGVSLSKVGIAAASGAAGGEASLYCGPACGGAVAGGLNDLGNQVNDKGSVNGGEVVASAVLGGVFGRASGSSEGPLGWQAAASATTGFAGDWAVSGGFGSWMGLSC
jgi:RHS repeat-associated protein